MLTLKMLYLLIFPFLDTIRNACHGSSSAQCAGRELEYFFPTRGSPRNNTAVFTDCTCCIIKPHCVQNGRYHLDIHYIITISDVFICPLKIHIYIYIYIYTHREKLQWLSIKSCMYIAAGQIISAIQKMGFEVSAIQMFTLDRANVEEFYEIYKGVVNEYASMVDQLTTGALYCSGN